MTCSGYKRGCRLTSVFLVLLWQTNTSVEATGLDATGVMRDLDNDNLKMKNPLFVKINQIFIRLPKEKLFNQYTLLIVLY